MEDKKEEVMNKITIYQAEEDATTLINTARDELEYLEKLFKQLETCPFVKLFSLSVSGQQYFKEISLGLDHTSSQLKAVMIKYRAMIKDLEQIEGDKKNG